MPFIHFTSIFLWIFILINLSSTDNLRNRKLEQNILLAYVNGINIIAHKNVERGNEPRERPVIRRLKLISSKVIND